MASPEGMGIEVESRGKSSTKNEQQPVAANSPQQAAASSRQQQERWFPRGWINKNRREREEKRREDRFWKKPLNGLSSLTATIWESRRRRRRRRRRGWNLKSLGPGWDLKVDLVVRGEVLRVNLEPGDAALGRQGDLAIMGDGRGHRSQVVQVSHCHWHGWRRATRKGRQGKEDSTLEWMAFHNHHNH